MSLSFDGNLPGIFYQHFRWAFYHKANLLVSLWWNVDRIGWRLLRMTVWREKISNIIIDKEDTWILQLTVTKLWIRTKKALLRWFIEHSLDMISLCLIEFVLQKTDNLCHAYSIWITKRPQYERFYRWDLENAVSVSIVFPNKKRFIVIHFDF